MKLLSSLFAGALVALFLTATGTHDMEGYETTFFSLSRGTGARFISVLGHHVYTMSIGLGVRMPLNGSLGASPVAALAPLLPAPLTYVLLLTVSLGAAILIIRWALEPLCGRRGAWAAVALLCVSVPMVTYTVYNDWPEAAVTYAALLGCIFAPHALITIDSRWPVFQRRLATCGVMGIVAGLVGMSHSGHWPQLLGALALSTVMIPLRPSCLLRGRLTTFGCLALVVAAGVLIHVPDLMRELALGAGLERDTEGATGSLLTANLHLLTAANAREPFTLLPLVLVACVASTRMDRDWRIFVLTGGAISVTLGMAASTLGPGSSRFAPSALWILRDPAFAFAVLSAAAAGGALIGPPTHPTSGAGRTGGHRSPRCSGRIIMLALLAAAGLQGPLKVVSLLLLNAPRPVSTRPWNQDFLAPAVRLAHRGMPTPPADSGRRVALWPGVRDDMRQEWHASIDWADAGYSLVTAWTKNRTMAGLSQPNKMLFDQDINLTQAVLCERGAVAFLQLRFLLLPVGVRCDGWSMVDGVLVDGRWALATAPLDDRVRTVQLTDLQDATRSGPALGGDLALIQRLVPRPDTSLTIHGDHLSLDLGVRRPDRGAAVVLPVAYDPGWQSSAGQIVQIGGLLAVVQVGAPVVQLTFVPDWPLRLRAVGMALAQVVGLLGLVALGVVGLPPAVTAQTDFD